MESVIFSSCPRATGRILCYSAPCLIIYTRANSRWDRHRVPRTWVPGEVSHCRDAQLAHPASVALCWADLGTRTLVQVLLKGWVIWRGFRTSVKVHIQPQISQVMPFLCFTLRAYFTHTQFLALPTQGEINSFPPMARVPVTPKEPPPLPGDLKTNTISVPRC